MKLEVGVPYFSSFLACFEWCVGMLKAKTLIGHCIFLEKAINIKTDGIIH